MRLYALCDQELLNKNRLSLSEFINNAKKNNAEIIQYRCKNLNTSFIKEQLINIRKEFDGYLIVNDKYELVEYCDGIHVGQEDLYKIDNDKSKAISILRKFITKEKIIGISTHNEQEVLEANSLDINYIGLGAYKNTNTKMDTVAILGESLDKIAALSVHPVAAIGGVRFDDKFKNITYHVIGSGLIN